MSHSTDRVCCPSCGRPIVKPRAVPPAAVVDTAGMSIAELFAHYKRTALIEDLRFYLRLAISPELRSRIESIAKPSRHDLSSIAQAWREERNAAERAAGIPAIGVWVPKPEELEPAAGDLEFEAAAVVDVAS